MRKRRVRWPAGSSNDGMTAKDLEAIRTYRENRSSRAYYRDLAVIDTAPQLAPTDKNKTDKGETE